MKETTQIIKSITALALMLVFMLPVVAEVVHSFQDEGHTVCDDTSEHLHAEAADCHFCHLQLATFHYNVVEYSDFPVVIVPEAEQDYRTGGHPLSFRHSAVQLRAPPTFLL